MDAGTQERTTTARTRSWRDDLAADYEIQQARLEVVLELDDEAEEYL
ncbi:MAG TPA: hypothetical protein VKZ83_00085 [Phototrophicaceae bacterium]|nr:hypothetical protein [Phototrophicaceae bacterium]